MTGGGGCHGGHGHGDDREKMGISTGRFLMHTKLWGPLI